MRALPADSFAYLASTDFGNTAAPAVVVGAGLAAGLAASAAGFAAAAAGAAASAHWALRKSFHYTPLSVFVDLAALYLALHSCAVRAELGPAPTTAKAATAVKAAAILLK